MADSAPDSSGDWLRRPWLRRLAVALGSIAALILVAWLAVPPIVRAQLESRLTDTLHRRTTVEKVAFDPFSLRVTITKLAVADTTGNASFAACDEIVADLSAASLWHRAPVLDALRLVRPSLSLARDRDGRYSIEDLLERPDAATPGPPPRFSVNNIEVEDGSVAFDDGPAARKHTLAGLALGIPFVSSLAYEADIKVTPRAEGRFNGSHFVLGGSSVPFAEKREAAIDIDLDALPIRDYVAYLPGKLRVGIAGGTLTTRLKVVFVDGGPGERRLEVRGDAQVDNLALTRPDGSVLVAAEYVATTLDRVDLVGRDARIASVSVAAPTVDVRRLAGGAIELAGPWFDPASPRASEPPPAAGSPAKPWSVSVAKATLARGRVALADATSTFRSTLVDVAIDATNLTTKPGEKAHVALAFVSDDRIASFKGEADVEPLVPAASGRFELAKFSLALLSPFYRDALAVDVQKGSLDLGGRFALAADGNVTIAAGTATIDDLRLAFPGVKEPLWRIPHLALQGVDADVAARRVAIGELLSRGATLRIARERDGTLEAARLMKTTRATGTPADERTWTLAVKRSALERSRSTSRTACPRRRSSSRRAKSHSSSTTTRTRAGRARRRSSPRASASGAASPSPDRSRRTRSRSKARST
jgi:hypothetical protein